MRMYTRRQIGMVLALAIYTLLRASAGRRQPAPVGEMMRAATTRVFRTISREQYFVYAARAFQGRPVTPKMIDGHSPRSSSYHASFSAFRFA